MRLVEHSAYAFRIYTREFVLIFDLCGSMDFRVGWQTQLRNIIKRIEFKELVNSIAYLPGFMVIGSNKDENTCVAFKSNFHTQAKMMKHKLSDILATYHNLSTN